MDHRNEKKRITFSSIVTSLIVGASIIFISGYAATTVTNDIQTDGNLSVTGVTTLMAPISFAATSTDDIFILSNGWRFTQGQASSTRITVVDASSTPILTFDESR